MAPLRGEPVCRPTRLPELIDRVLATHASSFQKSEIQVQKDFPKFLPPVPADPELLLSAISFQQKQGDKPTITKLPNSVRLHQLVDFVY